MNDAEKNILNIVKKQERLTLEGNREFFTILIYSFDSFSLLFGDSMTNEITSDIKISEQRALKEIKKYVKHYCKSIDNKSISTDEKILECLQKILDI